MNNRCLLIRLNRESGKSRNGPATVKQRKAQNVTGSYFWEGVPDDEAKSGELPIMITVRQKFCCTCE